MQICELCTQFDSCGLDKRKEDDVYSSCKWFELFPEVTQDRYESLKAHLRNCKTLTATAHQKKTIIDVDIPLEIKAEFYPHPFAFLDFLNCNIAVQATRNKFISKYITPHFDLTHASMVHDFAHQLIEAHGKMRAFAAGRGTLEDLNRYLEATVPRIYDDGEGLKCTAKFRGNLPGAMSQGSRPIALFFLQLAEFLLRRQELKQCPVCREYFQRGKRGPKGDTCGKDKCQKALKRNPSRYIVV